MVSIKIERIFINFICGLLPSKNLRHKLRKKSGASIINYIDKYSPQSYSLKETIKLLQDGYSISRFGDGEFSFIINKNIDKKTKKVIINNVGIQNNNLIREKLKYILLNNDVDKLLIGIPKLEGGCAFGYGNVICKCLSQGLFINYDKNIKYANSLISRLDGFKFCDLSEYKKIWNNKKVVFIRSIDGKFWLDDRLFDNIAEKKFIDIPSCNAFSEYDRILTEARIYSKDYIFFVSAGFTASVLAYDLSKLGYQVLDFGHLTACYREFLGELSAPEKI